MVQLELLGTSGCHLCKIAEQLIIAHLDLNQMHVEAVDISESNRYMELYATCIPVLLHPASGKDLHWPFDAVELLSFVNSC